MSKRMNVAVWVATALVAALFLFAGVPKLMGKATEGFVQVGYPPWFSYAIGAIEVGGALLLLVPRAATVGAAMLLVIMIGAVATHLRMHDLAHAPPALIAGILCAFIAWQRRDRLFGTARLPPAAGPQGDEYPRAR